MKPVTGVCPMEGGFYAKVTKFPAPDTSRMRVQETGSRQADRQECVQKDIPTYTQRQTRREAHTHTHIQTDRQADRQTGTQVGCKRAQLTLAPPRAQHSRAEQTRTTE